MNALISRAGYATHLKVIGTAIVGAVMVTTIGLSVHGPQDGTALQDGKFFEPVKNLSEVVLR